jgi:ABC-type cobalamin/Fe3+-siderophores transport system ATPase subunit
LVGVATRFQLALILFGTGSNGKSTLLKTVERQAKPSREHLGGFVF